MVIENAIESYRREDSEDSFVVHEEEVKVLTDKDSEAGVQGSREGGDGEETLSDSSVLEGVENELAEGEILENEIEEENMEARSIHSMDNECKALDNSDEIIHSLEDLSLRSVVSESTLEVFNPQIYLTHSTLVVTL